MYTSAVLQRVMESAAFRTDLSSVRQSLSMANLGQDVLPFPANARAELNQFVECVLCSAPEWAVAERHRVCRAAAEIAELLSILGNTRMRLKSALLYELAGLPAITQTIAAENNLPPAMKPVLQRIGPFQSLRRDYESPAQPPSTDNLAEIAMASDANDLAAYMQGEGREPSFLSVLAARVAKLLNLGLTASEMQSIQAVFHMRVSSATRSNVSTGLFHDLRDVNFPAELWPAQTAAIDAGLLDVNYDSWGLAAPTGTGKTFLTQLLVLDALRRSPERKILYLAPSRALVHEVATNLDKVLAPLAYSAVAVTPQLLDLDQEESAAVSHAAVVVLTPEKADMLLRLGADIFSDLSIVIVDEAHHLESSTRGILLEMYLWRLKTLVSGNTRFVFLSAVAPNIEQIAKWMRPKARSVTIDVRPTRLRAGVYRLRSSDKNTRGVIEYTDGTAVTIVEDVAAGVRRQLVQAAHAVSEAGSVLIVAKGKGECETLAELMLEWVRENRQSERTVTGELIDRADSRLEREMYAEVPLRKLISHRIAYHHAGLPPRVRTAVEDAIRAGLIDFVFATTTLAEGVNFPFATVIVQSLALREQPQKGRPSKYHPVTPRVFWNLAGRAGRPGFDKEGQVVLFEPSLGLDKIQYVIGDYFNAELRPSEPVRSALSETVRDIASEISAKNLTLEEISEAAIPPSVSRGIQGAVNLIRVSLLHARASRLRGYEQILEGTFAFEMLNKSEAQLARRIFAAQSALIDKFFSQPSSPPVELAAELGLSIETLQAIRDWVRSLQDFQIENMRKLLFGGDLNSDQAKYVIGPIAKHMAELEGPKLGGFLSEVILQWLSGVPFSTLRANLTGSLKDNSIEDLISLVYSRVQYLLPWGMYAADRLVEAEAQRRGITYTSELRNVAYLVDSGVPSFDAMRLVHRDFERTDATRLAREYKRRGGLRLGVDILGWLSNLSIEQIVRIVRGTDNRRLDYDLQQRVQSLSSKA